MIGPDSARLREDEREALMSAARESQTGCLEGEECCYDSLDAMIPAIERILAARLDAAEAALGRVEALADEWADDPGIEGYINLGEAEDRVRAALAPEVEGATS